MRLSKRLRASGLLLTMICGGLPAAEAAKGLRSRAEKHDLLIGTAVRFYHRDPGTQALISPFRHDAKYRSTLAKEFNAVTPENVMKMGQIHPNRGSFAFSDGDELVDFAARNGMGVHGHTLVWHQQLPQWFASGNLSKQETLEVLEEHVRIQVQITELDVRIVEPATVADLKAQARIYQEVMEICLEAANCTAFVMWGFTDRYSWIPAFIPGSGSALILDESYKKKPAYKKLNKALK